MTLPNDLGPLVRDRLHEPDGLPPPRIAEMGLLVHQTAQERGFMPRFDTGRFQSMFNATKLVVAGAIVALFGGLLLTGVLTQPNGETRPPVGASASANAVTAEPSEQAVTETTVGSDILPGVGPRHRGSGAGGVPRAERRHARSDQDGGQGLAQYPHPSLVGPRL